MGLNEEEQLLLSRGPECPKPLPLKWAKGGAHRAMGRKFLRSVTLQVDEVKCPELSKHPGGMHVGVIKSHKSLNAENLSQLWSEKERRGPLSGGRGWEPRNAGTCRS